MTALGILLVEDEPLIALDFEAALQAAGYRVIGPAATLMAALDMAAREPFEAAVLDVKLGGDEVWPLAALLKARHIPFLFVTGAHEAAFPPDLSDARFLGKPVAIDLLLATLAELVAARGRDT